MRKHLIDGTKQLSQPWLIAVLLCTVIPAFPEYLAPFLAMGSVFAAFLDLKLFNRSFKIGMVGKFILIYIAYLAVNLIYSMDIATTLSTLGMWISMFCIYLTFTSVITNLHRFDSALFCVSLLAGVVGLIAVIQYVLIGIIGLNLSPIFWNFADSYILNQLDFRILFTKTGYRVSSTFNNPNILAEYLVMVSPFVAFYAFHGNRSKTTVLCKACLIALVLGIAFTFSRASYIAILVIGIVFLATNVKRISKTILLASTALLLVPESVFNRFMSVGSGDSSIMERFDIWHAGLNSIIKNPIFGYGAGTGITWNLLMKNSVDAPHMHNLIFQLFAEGGIIAILIFVAIAWSMLHIGLDIFYKESKSRILGTAIIAFLAGFFANGLFDFPLMTPKLVGIFVMVAAIIDTASVLYLEKKLISIKKPAFPPSFEENLDLSGAPTYTSTLSTKKEK